MRVFFHTFGCKANQYDTERMRQELQARGVVATANLGSADVCVVNTCTVTNAADAEAKRFVRRIKRESPRTQIVVAGCSAVLRTGEYTEMNGVASVVPGHDPVQVAAAVVGAVVGAGPPPRALLQLGMDRGLDGSHLEPIGAAILDRREGATRGWLKVQDGCDRKCAFCATRLARGASRSRSAGDIILEARMLSRHHPELVLTGIHIGHYGRDLEGPITLSMLLARLLDAVPDVRFRLGSIEATEIDELLLELLRSSGGRVAPHLHMPLQSGADPVLRRMKRWHTREGVPGPGVPGRECRGPNRLGGGYHHGLSGRDRRGPRRYDASRGRASLHVPPRLSVFTQGRYCGERAPGSSPPEGRGRAQP